MRLFGLSYPNLVAVSGLAAGSLLFSGNIHAVVITTTYSDSSDGGMTFGISSAGSREAYAEAVASCDPSLPLCGAGVTASASTSYDVTVSASAAFYGATGLSVGSSLHIPLDVSFSLLTDGRGRASVTVNGNNRTIGFGTGLNSFSDTWNYFVLPGGGVSVTLEAGVSANANSSTGPYIQESFAWADPIVSISSSWEYAEFADLLTINEALDPVEAEMIGVMPDGYTLHLPEGSALLPAITAVPVPAAVWLFGSGLIGLIGVARRNKSEN